MSRVELRSDTFTMPGPGMREAMAKAEVGDDVWGEDPSVRRLEEVAAELLGKPRALFVPSGTMANQLALRAHAQAGDAALVGRGAHIYQYEGGAAAALWGVQLDVLDDALFGEEAVRERIWPDDPHFARTRLVCVENTHNRSGGRVFPIDDLRAIAQVCRERGLALHMDGARLFNSVAASGVSVREQAACCDSVAFCLSKGIGAPVGSLLVGSDAVVERAHRFRKLLGGAMRQSGVLAAAGLWALEHNLERLADDHANARRLAEGAARIPGLAVPDLPETNIVLLEVPAAGRFVARARERDVWLDALDGQTVRAVTHLGVGSEHVARALEVFAEAVD